ncbi:MAG TPA: elongation factor P [Candidatus Saccharibacteria bacterium]|nr:elongation factor P [Candidatus Saccharibacteria bacterium]
MALGVTDLRKGAVFSFEGHPYRVTEYSQKVVGRGGSIVNVTIKSLLDGKVLQKTFKGNEQLDSVDLAYANVQYLYNDGSKFYFMDNESYEQIELNADVIGEQVGFLKEGDTVKAMKLDGTTVSVELPKNVYLEVTYSEDVVKGDTTSSVLKDATLETGITVKVPAFIKTGDVISVDTDTWEYRERKK